MILLYIVIAAFLICGFFLYKSCNTLKEFIYSLPGLGIFGSAVSVILYLMLTITIYEFVQKTWVQCLNCKIISINSSSNIEGNFILGTGYINNTKYYYYRVQQEDGGINEYTAPVYKSTIYETDMTPRIERYVLEMSRDITFIQNPQGVEAYKFYVPKGTVIKEFIIR